MLPAWCGIVQALISTVFQRYRTQPCNDGATCARKVCFFAHTLEELRVPSSSPCGSELGASKPGNDTSSTLLSVAEEGDTGNKENYNGDSFEAATQTGGVYLGNGRNAAHGGKARKPANLVCSQLLLYDSNLQSHVCVSVHNNQSSR